MPQSKKSTYKRKVFFGLALLALSASLLFLFFFRAEAPPAEVEPQKSAATLIQIAPGSTFQKSLKPDEPVVIGVSLGQNRVLRFSIEKGDLPLSTVLYGPDEKKLIEHVSREFEVVELSFPTEVAGLYKIELRSDEKTKTGRPVELKIYPSTFVTPADRKDSEARQALSKAEVLRSKWQKDSLQQAVDQYDKAANAWTSNSDLSNASLAEIKAGDVCFRLAQYPEARKRFETVAKLSKQNGDRISEGRALSRLANLYSYSGDNDRAYTTITQALALLESRSNSTPAARHAYSEAVNYMAEVVYAKGNVLKARSYFDRAREALPEDRNGQARVHLFTSYIAASTGQPDKAVTELHQALDLYRDTGDKAGEGLALTALGLSCSMERKEDEAVRYHREAIKLFRDIGDRHSEALALNALGQAFENLGDNAAALQNYQDAVSNFESIGALDFAVAALYKVATVHRLNGKFDEALTEFQRSLELSRRARNVRFEAFIREGVALVYNAQGRSEEAVRQYASVQDFYRRTGDVRGQAVALNNYGDFLFKLDQKQQALALYSRALPLSKQVGDTGTLLATLYNLSRTQLSLGSYEPALSIIQESIKIIEDLRDSVGSPDLRALYFAVVRKHYALCIEVLMQFHRAQPERGFNVEALLVSDRSRARSLVDLLSESPIDSRPNVSPELVERERELRGLIRIQAQYQMELSLNPKNSVEAAEASQEVSQLRAEYQALQAQLWKQTPKLDLLRPFAPNTLADVQNELRGTDTMLLQYSLGVERSYLWAVTANSVESYELPSRTLIEDSAREVYQLLIARQTPVESVKGDYQAFIDAADKTLPEKATRLSQMILGPIAKELGTRKLIVSTEGALQSIPFETLPAPDSAPANSEQFPDSLLINTHEISSLPSISILRAIRSEKRAASSPQRTVAVFADPVFSKNDERVSPSTTSVIAGAAPHPDADVLGQLTSMIRGGTLSRLIYSSAEADAISAAAPRGTSLVVKGFDASRETLMKSRVADYQIVHLATHAFLDSEHPELSGIVLTMVDRHGSPQNGMMPLLDVYSLNLSAELTVLSACQTALGKDVSGEGFMGLTHSFLSAGSKSVVASLWKVDDQATASLMTRLYKSLLQQGLTTGAALRAAKLQTMKEKQWHAPYYWAGFVLQGESVNRIVVEDDTWPRHRWLLLALVISTVLVVTMLVWRRRRSIKS